MPSHLLPSITISGTKGSYIGNGTYGVVYKQGDRAFKHVKLFDADLNLIENNLKEVALAKWFSDNPLPNVMAYHDVHIDPCNKEVIIEMDYGAWDLGRFMPRLPTTNRMEYGWKALKGMVRGLNGLHLNGIVHGDVKPSNIIVMDQALEKFDIAIADLGSAQINVPGRMHPETQVIGTYMYSAPEILRQTSYLTQEGDAFSLGAVMFCLVTNRNYLDLYHKDVVREWLPSAEGTNKTDFELYKLAAKSWVYEKLHQHYVKKVFPGVDPELYGIVMGLLNPNNTERTTIKSLYARLFNNGPTSNVFTYNLQPSLDIQDLEGWADVYTHANELMQQDHPGFWHFSLCLVERFVNHAKRLPSMDETKVCVRFLIAMLKNVQSRFTKAQVDNAFDILNEMSCRVFVHPMIVIMHMHEFEMTLQKAVCTVRRRQHALF